MSEIPLGKYCRRCGRWFISEDPDQEYGPVCVRKLAGSRTLLDGNIEIRDKKGKITTVIV